eukprot:TRINITY_DN863_c0_g1_i5.p1 TRINITY_DN863_c0_g1~~TRINITY_DN863_c0_g1_i5.p1  ORF type:complete len:6170 (-),score=768.16 TRINITY_DN863_c0_g1_i5:895-19404(-)
MGYPAGGYTVTFTGTNFAKWSTLTFSSVSVGGVACTASSELSTGNFQCTVPSVSESTLTSTAGGADVTVSFTTASGTLPGCPTHTISSAFEMWGACGDGFKQLPEACDYAQGQGDVSGCLSDCTVDASPVSSSVTCNDPSLLCTCTGATTSITESTILSGDQGGQWKAETNSRCTANNVECNANKMVTGNGWWVDFWPQAGSQAQGAYSAGRVVCPDQDADDQQLRNLFKDAVSASKTDQWASEGDDCDISESAGGAGDWDRTVANLFADTGGSIKYDFNAYDNNDGTDSKNTVLISINFNTIYRVKRFYLDSTTDHSSGGGPQDHRLYYTLESLGYGTGIGDYLSNHQKKWIALDDGKQPNEVKSYYVGGQYGAAAAQVLIQVGSMKDMGLKRFYLEVFDSCTDSGTTANCKEANPSDCTRTYNNPTVTGVTPTSGTFLGGTTVTILGTNFGEGFSQEAPVGYLGTYQCASTVYLDESNMKCVTPMFYNIGAVTAKVDLTGVSKQATSAGNEFTISDAAPTISSLNPASMGCHARDVITVGGTNFKTVTWNSNSYTLLPYTIGGTRVPYAERDSDTQLWLTPAAGVGKDHDAVFMYLKAGSTVDVIPWDATSFWKWEQDGTDYWTPTNRDWMDPTSGWTDTWNGPRTAPITEGSGISNSIYHLYIRGTFNNPGNFEVTGVRAYWDDGVTIFLNGNQWFQKGSCVATCDHNVKANCCQDNQQTDGDILTSFKPSWLRTGTNVLAAAMSQADGSSDYTFNFRLTGRFWDTDTLAVSHTLVDAFSYDLPSITARTPVSGYDEGGYSITLEGACFGHINHASTTVTIDGNSCNSYTWRSDSKVECVVPSGSGASKDILATVASQTSAAGAPAHFTYTGPAPTPTVTGIDPSSADTGGGNTVTILGTNFYAWSATGNNITVGGTACGSLQVIDTTHIECINHPAGVGGGVTVTVQLGGKSGSNDVFYYSPPTLASGAPTSAPGAGGTTVTFTGTQFGPTSTTNPQLWIDGEECTSPEVLSTTLVKCNVPAGGGDNLNVTLCIAGNCVYNQAVWKYDDPVVTSVNEVSPAGGILTITGSNFGHNPSKVTARLSGPTVACTVTEVSNTNIVCTLPAGVGDGYSVAATVGTLADLEMCIFSYAAPQISGVHPAAGPPSGNTLVTIAGLHFGTAASGAAVISFGGSACTSPVVVNDTAVVCNTPAGFGSGISVQVDIENTAPINLNAGYLYSLGGNSATNPFLNAFDGSTATKSRSTTSTAGAAAVGVTFCAPRKLTSFKYWIDLGEVWRGDSARMEGTNDNFASDTDLATLPAAPTGNALTDIASSDTSTKYAAARYRTVVLWGRAYVNELEFWGKMGRRGTAALWSYYPPVVTFADPVVGKPAGGFVLTISGSYFGPASTSLTVDLRGVAGNYSCTSPQVVHDSLIYCDVPAGFGVAMDVDVTLAGQSNTPNTLYNYALPDLWDISPKNGLAAGGYTITIIGDNLGLGVNGYIDGSRCTSTNAVSTTEMHCIAPPGVGLFHKFHIAPKNDLNIPVNDSSTLFFNYDPPTISSITGTPRKPAGGDTVTFNGQGFGPAGTYVEAFLNGTSCQSTNTLNDGAVECVLPAGVGVDILPSVNVSTQFGNSSIPIFTYDKPTVTSIDPDKHDASGGDITVTGTNFGTVTVVSQLEISVQGTACASVAVISDTKALCTTPTGYGGSLDVRVTIATQENPSANTLFSYNIPTVVSVTPDNGNTLGGYPITLAGINYGPFGESTPTVTVDGQTCPYVSHTTTVIVCTAPNHAGKNLSVVATTDGPTVTALTSLSNALFSYDPPTVASVDPDTGATGGSYTLTVTGTNFGPSGTASAAVLGTITCGSSTVIHDSELQCSVPAGSGAGLAVQVSIDTAGSLQSGSTAAIFTYNAPTVASLSPDTGDADGGDVIQITGTNYGPPGTPVAASISGTACTTATITGDTTMDCTVPPGIGVLHDIQVTVPDLANKQVSAPAPGQDLFTYDRPLVTGVNPNEQPGSGGATITVLGKNFGTDTSTAVGITLGGTTCANPTHLSDTEARCEIPLGFGAKINIEATVATLTSVTNDLWTYQRPIITKVTPDSGLAIGGFNITIDGANFGLPVPAAVPFLSPFVNNVSCAYQVHTDTQLICTVPAGVGNLLSVDVLLKGARNDVNQYFTYAPPNVTDVSPKNGVTAGGVLFSVEGDNFGPPGTPAVVRIGSRTSTSCFSASDVLVTCAGHADGSGTGHSVFLTVGGQTSSISSSFTYNSPTIGSLTPTKRKTNGGQFLTVTGTNFGPHDSGPGTPINIRLGGTDCTASVHLSDTQVRCTVPEGIGLSKSIQVTVPTGTGNAQTSPAPVLFTYRAPEITAVSPNEQPTAGSTWVTVQGTNFGPAGFAPLTVGIGGSACTSPSILSHELAKCQTPAGIGGGINVVLSRAGQDNTGQTGSYALWTYERPTVTNLDPDTTPAVGGVNITITGTQFGPAGTLPTASIGGTVCSNPVWLSGTSMLCSVPAGVGLNLVVTVTIGGNTNNPGARFTYAPPTVTLASLQTGPTLGGSVVTLSGTNFGVAGNSVVLKVGGIACQNPTNNVLSDTKVKCVVPAGIGYNRDIFIDASGQDTTLSNAWTYLAPTVLTITPTTGGTSGGYMATIAGTNFGPSGTFVAATLGGVNCLASTWLADNLVRCQVPAGSGGSKGATVVVGNGAPLGMEGRLAARGNLFTYDPPGVTGLVPPALLSNTIGGLVFTVLGSNFGASAASPAQVLVGGTLCQTTTWLSDTELKCLSPFGTGFDRNIQVSLDGAASTVNPSYRLTYQPPVVTGITPDNLDTVGGLVTITGNYFGPQDYRYGHFLTVHFDIETDMARTSGAGPFLDKAEVDTALQLNNWPAAATSYGGYFIDRHTLKIGVLNDPRAQVAAAAFSTVTVQCKNGQTVIRNHRGDASYACERQLGTTTYVSPVINNPTPKAARYQEAPYIISMVASDPKVVPVPGPDASDTITITFNKATNKPAVNNRANIFKWLKWTGGIGHAGNNYNGAWNAAGDELTITIVNAGGNTLTLGAVNCAIDDTDGAEFILDANDLLDSQKGVSLCPELTGDWGGLLAVPPNIPLHAAWYHWTANPTYPNVTTMRLNDGVVFYTSSQHCILGATHCHSGTVQVVGSGDLIHVWDGTSTWENDFNNLPADALGDPARVPDLNSAWGGIYAPGPSTWPRAIFRTYASDSVNIAWTETDGMKLIQPSFAPYKLRSLLLRYDPTWVGASTGTIYPNEFPTIQFHDIRMARPDGDQPPVCVDAVADGANSITFSFNIATNKVAQPPASLSQAAVDAGLEIYASGTMGGSYTGHWVDPQTFRVTWPGGIGGSFTIADTIFAFKPAMGIQNPADPFSVSTNTRCPHLNGTLPSTSGARIVSVLAQGSTNAADKDGVSAGDTLRITFETAMTFTPAPVPSTKAAIDQMFTFSESLGTDYTGAWSADKKTLTITCIETTGNGNPTIGTFTIAPKAPATNWVPTLNIASYPRVHGDFGTTAKRPQPHLLDFDHYNSTCTGSCYTDTPPAYIEGTLCPEAFWVNDDMIICMLPRGTGPYHNISVDIDGQLSTSTNDNKLFTYNAPVLYDHEPKGGFTDGTSNITITGTNFGFDDALDRITVGGSECSVVSWINNTAVICQLPVGSGTGIDVRVEINNQFDTSPGNGMFTYDIPIVYDIVPDHGKTINLLPPDPDPTDLADPYLVTIVGRNFGPPDGAQTYNVSIGDIICLNHTHINDTAVTCYPKGGVGVHKFPKVQFNGQENVPNTTWKYFTYDRPIVTRVSPNSGRKKGGAIVTIYGENFGEFFNEVTVTIAGVTCEDPLWLSNYEMTCTTGKLAVFTIGTGSAGSSTQVYVGTQTNDPNSYFAYLDFTDPVCRHPAVEEYEPAIKVRQQLPDIPRYFNSISSRAYNITTYNGGSVNFPSELGDNDRCCKKAGETGGVCGVEFAPPANVSAPNIVEVVLDLGSMAHLTGIYTSWFQPCQNEPNPFYDVDYWDASIPGWVPLFKHVTLSSDSPCDTIAGDIGPTSLCVDYFSAIETTQVRMTFDNQKLYPAGTGFMTEFEAHGIFLHDPLYLRPVIPQDEYTQLSNFNVSWGLVCKTDNVNFLHLGPTDVMTQTVKVQLLAEDVPSIPKGTVIPLIGNITINPTEVPFLNQTTDRTTGWTHFEGISTYAPKEGVYRFVFTAEPPLDFRADLAQPPDPLNRDFLVRIVPGAPTQLIVNFIGNATLMSAPQTPLPHLEVIAADPAGNPVLISNWTYGAVMPSSNLVPIIAPSGQHPLILGVTTYTDLALERPRRGTHILTFTSNSTLGKVDVPLEIKPGLPDSVRVIDPVSKYREYNSNLVTPLGFIKVELLDAGGDPTANDQLRDFVVYNVNPSDPPLTGTLSVPSSNSQVTFSDLSLLNPPKQNWTIQFSVSTAAGSGILLSAGNFTAGILIGVPIRPLYDVDPAPYRAKFQTLLQNYTVYSVDAGDNRVLSADTFTRTCTVSINSTTHSLQGTTSKSMSNGVTYFDDLYIAGPPSGRYFVTTSCTGLFSDITTFVDVIPGDPVRLSVFSYNVNSTYYADYRNDITPVVIQALDAGNNFAPDWGWNGTLVKVTSNTTSVGGILNNTLSAGLTDFNNITFLQPLSIVHTVKFDAVGLEPGFLLVRVDVGVAVGLIVYTPTDIPPVYPTQVRHHVSDFNVTLATVDIRAIDAGGNQAIVLTSTLVTASSNTTVLYDLTTGTIPSSQGITLFPKLTLHRPVVGNHTIRFTAPNLAHVDLIVEINVGQAYSLSVLFWNSTIEYPSTFLNWLALIRVGAVDPGQNFAPATPTRVISVSIDGNTVQTQGLTTGMLIGGDIDFGLIYGQEHLTPYGQYLAANLTGTNATVPALTEGERQRLGLITPKAQAHTIRFSAVGLEDATLSVIVTVGPAVKLQIPPHLRDTVKYPSVRMSNLGPQEVWAMDAGENHAAGDGNIRVSATPVGQTSQGRPVKFDFFLGTHVLAMVNGTAVFTDLVLVSPSQGFHRFHYESLTYPWTPYDYDIEYVIGPALSISIPDPSAVVQTLPAASKTDILDVLIAAEDAGGSLLGPLDVVNRTISVSQRTSTYTLTGTYDKLMYRGETTYSDLAFRFPSRGTYYMDFSTPGLIGCNVTVTIVPGKPYRVVFAQQPTLPQSKSSNEVIIDGKLLNVVLYDASDEFVPMDKNRIAGFCIRPVTNTTNGTNPDLSHANMCESGTNALTMVEGQVTENVAEGDEILFPNIRLVRPVRGWYHIAFYSVDPTLLVPLWLPLVITTGVPQQLEATDEYGGPVKLEYKAKENVVFDTFIVYTLDAAGSRVLEEDTVPFRNMTIGLVRPASPQNIIGVDVGKAPDADSTNSTSGESILYHEGDSIQEVYGGKKEYKRGTIGFIRPPITFSNTPHTILFSIPNFESSLKLDFVITKGVMAKLKFKDTGLPPERHETNPLENPTGKLLKQPVILVTDELFNELPITGLSLAWNVIPVDSSLDRPPYVDLSPPVSDNGELVYTGLEMTGVRSQVYTMTWSHSDLRTLEWNVTIKVCEESKPFSQVGSDGIECECSPGYTDDGSGGCTPCLDGEYKDTPGVAPCLKCPDKMNTLFQKASTSRRACQCISGYYDELFAQNYNQTASCTVCPEGANCPGGKVIEQIPGYWRSSNSSDKFYKCVGQACLGGQQECAAGHEGPLCDVCESGHGKFGTTCEPCPEAQYSMLIFLITATLLIAHMLLVIRTANSDRSKTAVMQKILLNYLQVLSLVGGFAVEWPPALRGMFQASEGTSSVSFRMISVECSTSMSVFQTFYAQIAFPAVFICCVFVFNILGYGIRKIIGVLKGSASMESLGDALRSCIVPTLVVIFMTHPTVSKEVFNMFNCVTLDKDGKPMRYLVIDLSETCSSPEYLSVKKVALVMLFTVCLGVPLYGFLLLRIIRDNLTKTSIVNKFGFMYIGLKPETYFWEMTIILRKIGIVACSVFLREDPQLQVYAAMWVMQASLVGHLYLNPYVNRTCHNLEFAALGAIFITLYCIIMYNNGGLGGIVINLVTYGLWLTNAGTASTLVFVFVKNKIAMKRAMKQNTITMGELKEVTTEVMDDVDAQEDLWNGMVEKDLGLKKVTDELFDDQGVRDDLWRSFHVEDGEADLVHISEQVMGNELKEVREEFLKTLYDDDDDTSEIVKAD